MNITLQQVARWAEEGKISKEAASYAIGLQKEAIASAITSSARHVQKLIGIAKIPSKMKQLAVKLRLARPKPLVLGTKDWKELPAWYGKAKGTDKARLYERDVVHGGPMLTTTTLGKVVGFGGAGTAGVLTAHGVSKGIEKVRVKRQAVKGYKDMLKYNPDLAKIDPIKVKRTYRTMMDLAPDIGKNPQISGNFVRRIAGEYGDLGVDPKTAKELIDTQTALLKRRDVGRGSVANALRALGLGTGSLG